MTLSEQWKSDYRAFLQEEEEKLYSVDSVINSLVEAQNEVSHGFMILKEYYNLCHKIDQEVLEEKLEPHWQDAAPAGSEGTTLPDGGFAITRPDGRVEIYDKNQNLVSTSFTKSSTKNDSSSQGSDDSTNNKTVPKVIPMKQAQRNEKDAVEKYEKAERKDRERYAAESSNNYKEVARVLSNLTSDAEGGKYVPLEIISTQKISDMKFPKNIIFFIGQIIKWIRNIVIYFIEKIKNIFRRLFGKETKELDIGKAFSLSLERAKKIETIATTVDDAKGNKQIKLLSIPNNKIELLEGQSLADYLGITVPKKAEPVKTQNVIVSIDLSKDILNLKELVQNFYDLFDKAYGSYNEKLFETDDLKAIFEVFKDSINRLMNGETAYVSVAGGYAAEVNRIELSRVKDTLRLTNININSLKNAYVQTADKISDITKIIKSKEMLALSDLGVDTTLLSLSTYNQLHGLLSGIPARMKRAMKLEKDLNKMQKNYSALVETLSGMQRSFASISNVTLDVVYNRKVNELLDAANYMSQVVTLRLTGLALYIKELKEVRDILAELAGLNRVSMGTHARKLTARLFKH